MSNIKKFPLTARDNRIALLLGVAAKTVDVREVEHAILRDSAARPFRKPVVADSVYYASVTDAARAEVGPRVRGAEAHRLIMNAVKRISRWCDADNVEGYYWAEPQ